jgi:hypothetical protein
MVATSSPTIKHILIREATLFLVCLVFGLLLLPGIIYLVGQFIFGDFGGGGLREFYSGLLSRIRHGDIFVWFLILSPYLIGQTLRATVKMFRFTASQP